MKKATMLLNSNKSGFTNPKVNPVSPRTYCQQIRNLIMVKIKTDEMKPGDRLPSLRELGKIYGVSIGTINNAIELLEEEGAVISKPKVGVFVARDMLESSNVGGETLDNLKRRSIVLFLTTYEDVPGRVDSVDNFWDSLITLAMRSFATHGYSVAHFPVHEDDIDVLTAIPVEIGNNQCLFGVVYQGRNLNQLRNLQRLDVPVVYAHGMWSNELALPRVCVDGRRVGYEAVHYLYLKGHRQIGYIGSMEKNIGVIDSLKYEGYIEAMTELGLPIRPECCWPCLPCYQSAITVAKVMIDAVQRLPQAFVGANDQVAMGLIERMAESGIRCPEDVAVIGCDDIYMATRFTPALTTFSFDHRAFCENIVDMMLKRSNNPEISAENTFIPVTLIERESA